MDYSQLTTPLLLLAALPTVVAFSLYQQVVKMSEPEKMLFPLAGGLTDYQQQAILRYKEWLAGQNLHYLTSFQFGSIQVAVFQQQGTQRFLSFYFHQKLSYAIESRFDDSSFFETGTSNSMGLFPARPGAYRQNLPGVPAEVAWVKHLEAEDYLVRRFGIAWRPLSASYEQTLIKFPSPHHAIRSLDSALARPWSVLVRFQTWSPGQPAHPGGVPLITPQPRADGEHIVIFPDLQSVGSWN